MSAFFLAQITIKNSRRYAQYIAAFDEVFEKYRGQVVAVDDHPIILEGRWRHRRLVLIEFPSARKLRRWYESREYQDIAQLRRRASRADILLVHGRRRLQWS